MGRYLLDTHVAIWYFNGDDALSETAKEIMLDLSNQIHLSVVSAWELAIKVSLGKIKFNGQTARFIQLAEDNDFTIVPVKTDHLVTLESLPWIHRDPFDRLLLSTALSEKMTLITADKNITRYDVPMLKTFK
jgi:PIN domain nuclease of toxin-antitoxin system